MMLFGGIVNPAVNARVGNMAVALSGANILQLFLRNLITLAIGIGGIYSFFNLIRGGYEYITAGGDKEAVTKARQRLMNAMIGLVILLSLFVFIFLVETIFGISIRQVNIPNV